MNYLIARRNRSPCVGLLCKSIHLPLKDAPSDLRYMALQGLMELEVADAKAHAMFPIIQKRIDICSEWKDKKADELKARLLE